MFGMINSTNEILMMLELHFTNPFIHEKFIIDLKLWRSSQFCHSLLIELRRFALLICMQYRVTMAIRNPIVLTDNRKVEPIRILLPQYHMI